MNKLLLTILLTVVSTMHVLANDTPAERALWASLCGRSDAMAAGLQYHLNKVLVSWRMLPGDNETTGFDIYRKIGSGNYKKLNTNPITTSTCWQDASMNVYSDDVTYALTRAGKAEFLDTYTISKEQLSEKRPHISIPLKSTEDVCMVDTVFYQANDVSVGDLDGDGVYDIIVKRLQTIKDRKGNTLSSGTGAGYSHPATLHAVIWDAYRLDGSFLWRVKGGPQVILGNSSCFAVADFDGDGCAEMAIRTGEGTEFGDGVSIGDTDGDGIIDYRSWNNFIGFGENTEGGWSEYYSTAGPEFLSVIDGKTGRELARTDFIARDKSEDWGDSYWKRASSFRVGVGHFSGDYPSVFTGRGIYRRSVLEAWDYRNGQLKRRWHFDTSDNISNNNKDGKPNSAYAGQGNHSFNIADLDGDGHDDVMYGSMALGSDGCGLWSSGLGHGDANHVGKFLSDRNGLQVWHCLEGGTTMAALHDGATGEVIWKLESDVANDTGRCMVADIDPDSPGCEFWTTQNAFSATGMELGYKPSSSNAAIWWDGSLSRQLLDAATISSKPNGRVFTIYRYDASFNNSTKSNPCWYGDLLGDWREEVIATDATKLREIKIFSTWYPTTHKFPWLMTDHTYLMSALNQQAGYNQPTNLGYYIGSDLMTDREAWQQGGYITTSIDNVNDNGNVNDNDKCYNIAGQQVDAARYKGIVIINGKKIAR